MIMKQMQSLYIVLWSVKVHNWLITLNNIEVARFVTWLECYEYLVANDNAIDLEALNIISGEIIKLNR